MSISSRLNPAQQLRHQLADEGVDGMQQRQKILSDSKTVREREREIGRERYCILIAGSDSETSKPRWPLSSAASTTTGWPILMLSQLGTFYKLHCQV